MKRTVLLILFALLFASSAFAQWEVDEDFSNGIPDGWTTANGQWHWEQSGTFPTPYLWAESDIDYNLSPRLITSGIDVSDAQDVYLQYRYFFDGGGSSVEIAYGFSPNGPWEWWDEIFEPSVVYGITNKSIAQNQLQGDELYFLFAVAFDIGGVVDEFALDQFRVSTHLPGWVDVNASFSGNEIPPGGGNANWSLNVYNTLPVPLINLRYGVIVQQNGNLYGPFNQQIISVPANDILILNGQSIYIPGFAPPGRYYITTVVHMPNVPSMQFADYHRYDKDPSLTWTDTESDGYTPFHPELVLDTRNDPFIVLTNEEMPSSLNLNSAYPNPFNAATMIRVELPEASVLTVTVYNTLGQQVAQLADGSFNAGTYSFTFDGSNLASGIYFVHASAPGKLNHIQKIVLMK